MAEIKIEKKKPIWPWILLILIILGIIAFWYYNNQMDQDYKDDDATMDQMDNQTNTNQMDSNTDKEVASYDDGSTAMMALMSAMKDSSRFGTDSTFTKTAMNNLAKIIVVKARSFNLERSTALTELEQFAQNKDMQTTSQISNEKTTMSNHFKSVSDNMVSVLEDIQKKHAPAMQQEVSTLKQTASKIESNVDLSKQQPAVQSFFKQAHDLVHHMNS